MRPRTLGAAALAAGAAGGHIVYPALLAVLSRNKRVEPPPDPAEWPALSVVIPAYKEAGVIEQRVADVLANAYPGPTEVIVVADGDPQTAEAARRAGARTVEDSRRLGKAQALNRGVAAASHDVVVLTDANNSLAPGSLRRLVRWFDEPRVGAVAGEKTEADGGGEALYWRFESWLKQREAALGTTIAVVGELVAIRRDAWVDIPPGIGTDDFWLGIDLADRGWDVAYDPTALSIDPAAATLRASWERRTRSVAGGLNVLRRRGMRPRGPRGGLVSLEIWGHRLWRWTGGPAAHLLLVGWALRRARLSLLARAFLAAHVAALAGLVPAARRRRLALPLRAGSQVLYLQAVAVGGCIRYLRGERGVVWRTEER